MCLTIPKKIIEVSGNKFVVENASGKENKKQEVKSIIDVKVGDIVFTQNGVIIEKIDDEQLEEINNILKNYQK